MSSSLITPSSIASDKKLPINATALSSRVPLQMPCLPLENLLSFGPLRSLNCTCCTLNAQSVTLDHREILLPLPLSPSLGLNPKCLTARHEPFGDDRRRGMKILGDGQTRHKISYGSPLLGLVVVSSRHHVALEVCDASQRFLWRLTRNEALRVQNTPHLQ